MMIIYVMHYGLHSSVGLKYQNTCINQYTVKHFNIFYSTILEHLLNQENWNMKIWDDGTISPRQEFHIMLYFNEIIIILTKWK